MRTCTSRRFSISLTLCTTLSYFFSIVGSSVKIYSTSTGLVVSTLSAKRDTGSHTNAITSLILNPHNAYQLITGSLDGHIKVWDLLDGVLLQTIGVGNPVHHIAAHEQWKDVLFVAVARPTKRGKANGTPSFFADFQLSNAIFCPTGDDNDIVLRVSLKPLPATLHLPVQASSESIVVGKTRTTRGLAVSAGGSWLVAIGGHKAYVASTLNLKAGFVKFVSPEALTCLALHPSLKSGGGKARADLNPSLARACSFCTHIYSQWGISAEWWRRICPGDLANPFGEEGIRASGRCANRQRGCLTDTKWRRGLSATLSRCKFGLHRIRETKDHPLVFWHKIRRVFSWEASKP